MEYYIETDTQSTITTEKINGFLLGIFLVPFTDKLYKKYNISLSFNNYPSIFLLDEQNVGYVPLHIPIKVDYWNVNKSKYEAPGFWALNDKLRISVEGKGIRLKVILRVEVR